MEGSPPRMHPRSKVFSPVHPNRRFLPAFYPLCFRTMVENRVVTVSERIQMAPLQNQVSKLKSMETKSPQLHCSATMSNVLKYDMYYEQLGGVSMAPHRGPSRLSLFLPPPPISPASCPSLSLAMIYLPASSWSSFCVLGRWMDGYSNFLFRNFPLNLVVCYGPSAANFSIAFGEQYFLVRPLTMVVQGVIITPFSYSTGSLAHPFLICCRLFCSLKTG